MYTGTVYEIFLKDGSITSSIGSGGRYDNIIGAFRGDNMNYPTVGISFGLDVIYTALSQKETISSTADVFIIPLGTELQCTNCPAITFYHFLKSRTRTSRTQIKTCP